MPAHRRACESEGLRLWLSSLDWLTDQLGRAGDLSCGTAVW
jgi:hypothetical protein